MREIRVEFFKKICWGEQLKYLGIWWGLFELKIDGVNEVGFDVRVGKYWCVVFWLDLLDYLC